MSVSYTLSELAERLAGEVRGDPRVVIRGVNTVAAAQPDQITWVSDDKYRSRLSVSQAGAVLVRRDAGDAPMPSLGVDAVDPALCRLLELFSPPAPRPPAGVHATAVVAPTARLGRDVAVGPFVVIDDGAVIGDRTCLYAGVHIGAECRIGADCVLWNHVVVRERCQMGDRVILHPHVVLGGDGFGYYFADGRHNKIPHHGGRVVIADDVEIGAGSTVDRSKVGQTYIGPGTKIDNLVQVGHNVSIGAHCVIIALCGIGGSTVLGNGVVLGGQVGLRDNIRLGDGVVVTARSGVSVDIDAGQTVSGMPAVDHRQQLRELAVTRKLPDIAAQLKELARRVQSLEAATDHS